jgi:transcriptional regulator with XRE-family HTH domain
MVSTKTLQNDEPRTFAQRLRIAFGHARDAEIARQLGYKSQSPIAKWFDGVSYPSVEVLLKITQLTKVSLHWLLTGEGAVGSDRFQFLGEALLGPLHQMAELRLLPTEEMVRFLVREAMLNRCAVLTQRLDGLEPDEFVELQALLTIFSDPDLAAAAVANLRRPSRTA